MAVFACRPMNSINDAVGPESTLSLSSHGHRFACRVSLRALCGHHVNLDVKQARQEGVGEDLYPPRDGWRLLFSMSGGVLDSSRSSQSH